MDHKHARPRALREARIRTGLRLLVPRPGLSAARLRSTRPEKLTYVRTAKRSSIAKI
jgi:hypothetical protein